MSVLAWVIFSVIFGILIVGIIALSAHCSEGYGMVLPPPPRKKK